MTPSQAERALRDHRLDCGDFGGFTNYQSREDILDTLKDEYGQENITGWTLIGATFWDSYEEGGSCFLFVSDSDQSLWSLKVGTTVYGSYGSRFDEIQPTTIEEWIFEVESNRLHAESMKAI